MIKKIIASVVLLSLITIAIVQAMDNEPKGKDEKDSLGGLKIGAKAPDFNLKTLDGKQVELSDYKGKKVMLNFGQRGVRLVKRKCRIWRNIHNRLVMMSSF